MALDIHSAVQTTLVILVITIFIFIWQGVTSIRSARKLPFFRLRRNKTILGWRLLLGSLLLIIITLICNAQAEPFIYRYFPATITFTATPSATAIASITVSSTPSVSPTITQTPTITLTPTPNRTIMVVDPEP